MTISLKLPIKYIRRVFPGTRLGVVARSPVKINLTRLEAEASSFYKISDDDMTASSFLQALWDFKLEAARSFLSKHSAPSIDLGELALMLEGAAAYKPLIRAEFFQCPKNCKVESVLVTCGQGSPEAIVHLRMIKEPDNISSWKIYSVEKEG